MINYEKYKPIFATNKLEDKFHSTGDECLNLFSQIGVLRAPFLTDPESLLEPDYERSTRSIEEVSALFENAYYSDYKTTIKILLYARDVRKGLGERTAIRFFLHDLCLIDPHKAAKVLPIIISLGRYDDALSFLDTKVENDVVKLLKEQLLSDISNLEDTNKSVSLCAKWMPSINASNVTARYYAKKLAKAFGWTYKVYRQNLSKLRERIRIVENNLRKKDYTFDYGKIPSGSMFKYQKAFHRNDGERYKTYLEEATKNHTLNTSTLYPYEIVRRYITSIFKSAEKDKFDPYLEEAWKNFSTDLKLKNTLVVRDGSGSMVNPNFLPLAISTSMAILCSQALEGCFKDKFLTFSSQAKIVDLSAQKTLLDKISYCNKFSDISNTNIENVFNFILNYTILNKTSKKNQIKNVLIISDMQFDVIDFDTKYLDVLKEKFAESDVTFPKLIFWNANSIRDTFAATKQDNVILVSGASKNVFDNIINNINSEDPIKFMNKVLAPYDKYVENI